MEKRAHDRDAPETVAQVAASALETVRKIAPFLIDCNGRVVSCNGGGQRMLGGERADWPGQPVQPALTPDDVQRGVPLIERVATPNGARCSTVFATVPSTGWTAPFAARRGTPVPRP